MQTVEPSSPSSPCRRMEHFPVDPSLKSFLRSLLYSRRAKANKWILQRPCHKKVEARDMKIAYCHCFDWYPYIYIYNVCMSIHKKEKQKTLCTNKHLPNVFVYRGFAATPAKPAKPGSRRNPSPGTLARSRTSDAKAARCSSDPSGWIWDRFRFFFSSAACPSHILQVENLWVKWKHNHLSPTKTKTPFTSGMRVSLFGQKKTSPKDCGRPFGFADWVVVPFRKFFIMARDAYQLRSRWMTPVDPK